MWGQFLQIYTIWMLEYSDKVISQARKTHGYLYKKSSGLISIWQKRYFIIFQDTLTYYADQILVQAKKHIAIEEINYIKILGELQFHLVTKKRVYQLRAADQSDRDLWAASLNILINYKEWNKVGNQKQLRVNSKKEIGFRKHSRAKKSVSRTLSPPQLKKHQSLSSYRKSAVQSEFNPEQFFLTVNLPKLSQSWKLQEISNKIILLKEVDACYFIISCKTLLFSHEDDDLLNSDLISPYDFNCLYCYKYGQIINPQVCEICKCSEIQEVQEDAGKIRLGFSTKQLQINPQKRKTQTLNLDSIISKIKHAIEVGKQYHNSLNIKLKRNIDQMLYLYDQKQMTVAELAKKQIEKSVNQSKQGNHKQQLRKNMDSMKKILKQILNCCDAKATRNEFKEQFVKEYHEMAHQYLQKKWQGISKASTPLELKKVLLMLFDFWKLVRGQIKDDRLFQGAIAIQKILLNKFENQINSKIDSCFSLTQKQILDEVNIQIKGDESIKQKVDTIFFSNNIYRQFHLDIRLVLFEFSEMSIHQKSLQYYLLLLSSTFKHICEKTFKELDKWKDPNLILGTCNEIQFIKNSLFEEMFTVLTKEYKSMATKLKNQNLRQLQNEISNIEIMLVKKLFVMTFSDIDRNILNKPYDELNINVICDQIVNKMKTFSKINKYVKRNIYQASFEQICYFYYSNIIKFNKKTRNKEFTTDFFIRKMTDDFKYIGQCFHGLIYDDKIYTHLKDLSLIKDFIQCDALQIKATCQKIKKQFGNSFTETAFKNLFNLREMSEQLKQHIMNECSEIIKHSADSPEQVSFVSSSRQSFLQNWNNTRSRKSTLTLSLNEFYQNQQMMQKNKQNVCKLKQGYLNKKKLIKNGKSNEIRSYFRIKNADLIEYESEVSEDPINTYELQFIKKCYLHPQKPYMFIAQFPEVKLQFKCETTEEANEWIKNIYEEISSLSVMLKEKVVQKDKQSDDNVESLQKDQREFSTMQSYPKGLKDKSLQKSGDPVTPKKAKKEQSVTYSPSKAMKVMNIDKQKADNSNQCLKCSIGFFF